MNKVIRIQKILHKSAQTYFVYDDSFQIYKIQTLWNLYAFNTINLHYSTIQGTYRMYTVISEHEYTLEGAIDAPLCTESDLMEYLL